MINMDLKEFVSRFILHCIWALSAFILVALGMEFFIPGSVTPYMDPIPFVIIALIVLFIDSVKRPVKVNPWLRIATGLLIVILTALVVGSDIQTWSKSNIILIGLVIIIVGMTTWFVSSEKLRAKG